MVSLMKAPSAAHRMRVVSAVKFEDKIVYGLRFVINPRHVVQVFDVKTTEMSHAKCSLDLIF